MIESHFLETNLNLRTAFAGTRNRISVTRSSLPRTASVDGEFFCFGEVKMEEEEAIDPTIDQLTSTV